MDLREYYRKIREIEAEIGEANVVVVSRKTSEGGVRGVKSEVPRNVAAKLIADGRAVLACAEEAARYRETMKQRWQDATGQG